MTIMGMIQDSTLSDELEVLWYLQQIDGQFFEQFEDVHELVHRLSKLQNGKHRFGQSMHWPASRS